ncbi:MAG: hypothetical protein AAB316_12345, partial [Bacteroidota bacterium]
MKSIACLAVFCLIFCSFSEMNPTLRADFLNDNFEMFHSSEKVVDTFLESSRKLTGGFCPT